VKLFSKASATINCVTESDFDLFHWSVDARVYRKLTVGQVLAK